MFVGRGVAVGIGAGVEVEVVKAAATFASTVAPIAVSASRVPRIPASTVAGTSAVGRDDVCVSAGGGASPEQATAVRPETTKTIRMIILIVTPLRLPEIPSVPVGFPIVHVRKCASPPIADAVSTFMPPVPVSGPSGALFTGRTMASAW